MKNSHSGFPIYRFVGLWLPFRESVVTYCMLKDLPAHFMKVSWSWAGWPPHREVLTFQNLQERFMGKSNWEIPVQVVIKTRLSEVDFSPSTKPVESIRYHVPFFLTTEMYAARCCLWPQLKQLFTWPNGMVAFIGMSWATHPKSCPHCQGSNEYSRKLAAF